MSDADSMMLEFGSRTGSWFALGLFGAVFGALGLGVNRETQRRSPSISAWVARGLGLLLFLGPVSLIYVTSLGGFYEAQVDRQLLRLRYLAGSTLEVPLAQISEVRAVPWYRGRWRLQVLESSGRRYESATWDRESVATSTARLKNAVQESK
jgi:hypothetical protein